MLPTLLLEQHKTALIPDHHNTSYSAASHNSLSESNVIYLVAGTAGTFRYVYLCISYLTFHNSTSYLHQSHPASLGYSAFLPLKLPDARL